MQTPAVACSAQKAGGGKLSTDPCSSELGVEAGRGAGGGRAGDFGADPSGGSLGMEAIGGEHRSR